jgi:hypothetical protein
MVRQIIGRPSLPATSWLRLLAAGPESCPQAAGPLSGGVTVAGPAAVGSAGRQAARGGGDSEPRQSAHGQGDVPVPGIVLADLAVV